MKCVKSSCFILLSFLLWFVSCSVPTAPGSGAVRVFWGREILQISKADLRCAAVADPSGTVRSVIPDSGFMPVPGSLKIDSVNGRMYAIDMGGYDRIRRANLDGTGLETIVNGTGLFALCLDVTGNALYWSENKKIRKANLDGSGAGDVFEHLGTDIWYLAVDGRDGRLYFSDNAHIFRINTDGTGLEPLIDAIVFNGLEFDAVNRHLYWGPVGVAGIERADPDGQNRVPIAIGDIPDRGFAIDPAGSLYYAITGGTGDIIKRCGMNGAGAGIFYAEEGDQPGIYGLALEF